MKQVVLKLLRKRVVLVGSAVIAGLIAGNCLNAASVTPANAFGKIEARTK